MCDCAGSVSKAPMRLNRDGGSQPRQAAAAAPNRRDGGPGTQGFVWSGPRRSKPRGTK